MYIEYKGKDGIVGPARIGLVSFSKSGKTIYYRNKKLRSLRGLGFKANYCDVETGDYYWISGCSKDGHDALYNTDVQIDEDVREEYWTNIRNRPQDVSVSSYRAKGKY